MIGNPQAKVKIEVFEDFHCSACRSYWQNVEPRVVKEIVDSGKALYVFRQFPFEDDRSDIKDSDQAAMAAECAAEQNRFWDFKDMLFTNVNYLVGEFSDVRLTAFAKALGLDMDQFEACYAEKRYQAQIDADIELANNMNVGGTPSVFVNGIEVSPGKVPTFEQILQMVEQALASGG
jgi:protein-disulfide isomerase